MCRKFDISRDNKTKQQLGILRRDRTMAQGKFLSGKSNRMRCWRCNCVFLLHKRLGNRLKCLETAKTFWAYFGTFSCRFLGPRGLRLNGLCSFHTFGKISLHFVFASLLGRHRHGIGLHGIGSISLAKPVFATHRA
jgi:hypothetical protein